MNEATVDELIAAYALNACEPGEAAQIEQHLARNPRAAAELLRLSAAAAWIGATEALTPPPGLREAVLAGARARPRSRSENDDALDLFRDQTDRLDTLITRLRASDLSARTANGLSVRDLLIHLTAMESMMAAALVGTQPAIVESVDVQERTDAFVEAFALAPIEDVRLLWRQSVEQVADWAITGASGPLPWLGISLPRDTILVIRAFETWIHANDIRRAVGFLLESPRPAHLHRMAEFSMQSLPAWLEVTGRPHPGCSARIVLTGAGGGSWRVPLALGEADVVEVDGSDPADVVIETDVLDWCHRVGGRLATSAISVRVDGTDVLAEELAVDILEAASALATL
jgi:uncharacterized protein (TIGR03083 family)